VQEGPLQGDALQLSIQNMGTAALRISNTNLLSSISAEDAIGQIDFALGQVVGQASQLGGYTVSMNDDEDANNTASTNLTAAESNITDLNVPQGAVTFTRLQILGSIGTSVLAQANTNAETILALFR
jgi:flagellin